MLLYLSLNYGMPCPECHSALGYRMKTPVHINLKLLTGVL